MKKAILFIMLIFLASSVYSAELYLHWKMDEASGNLADSSANSFTGTAGGNPSYQTGNNWVSWGTDSIDFDGTGDNFYNNDVYDFTQDFTACVSYDNDAHGLGTARQALSTRYFSGAWKGWGIKQNVETDVTGSGSSEFGVYYLEGGTFRSVFTNYDNGFVCIQVNSTHLSAWFNGSQMATTRAITPSDAGTNFYAGCGSNDGCGQDWDGDLQEVMIFNGTLTADQHTTLYQTGLLQAPAGEPVASFIGNTPADSVTNNTLGSNISVECTNSGNATIWFGTAGDPNSVVSTKTVNNTYWLINSSIVTTDGVYYYKGGCSSPAIHGTNTSIRTWTYDTTDPTITLNEDTSGINASNQTVGIYRSYLPINITISDNIDLFAFLINITNSSADTKFSYKNESLSGTSWTYYANISTSGWESSNYTIEITASDSHTAKAIDNYDYTATDTELQFNTAEGNTIRIISMRSADWEITKETDRYKFSYAPFTLDAQDKYKFQVYCDNGLKHITSSGYAGHFVCMNWNTKKGNWLDFEGTKNPVTVTDEGGGWYEVEVEIEGDNVIFESIGGLNINKAHFLYTKSSLSLDSSIIFPTNPINETDLTLQGKATEGLGKQIDIEFILYENGTINQSGTFSNANSSVLTNLFTFSNLNTTIGDNFILSLRAESLGHYTSWSNSSAVQVQNFLLDNCSVGTAKALVVYFKDISGSNYNVNLSGTLEYSTTLTGSEISYSHEHKGIHNFSYCIHPAGLTLYTDITLQYLYSNDVGNYYTENTELSNSTKYVTIYVDDGEEITATVRDNYAQLLDGVYIHVQRYNVDTNTYFPVGQGKTNFEGQTKLYLIKNSVYYRFLLYYPIDTLKKTTTPTYIYSDNLNFVIDTDEDIGADFYNSMDIFNTLVFNNNTDNFVLTYDDPNLVTTQACLEVYKVQGNGNTLYNSSCLSATSGTILLGVPAVNGTTYEAKAYAYIPSKYYLNSASTSFYALSKMGTMGWLLVLVLTLVFAFSMRWSVTLGAIITPIPILLASIGGFINFPVWLAMLLMVGGIIIAMILNKEG